MTTSEILLSIFGGASIGLLITQLTNIGQYIGFKPFNCIVCMSLWSSFFIGGLYLFELYFLADIIAVATIGSVVSYFLTILIYK